MNAPRVDIDLGKLRHNAETLIRRLAARGISVTGVTKAVLGAEHIARAMLDSGVRELGDARIENIEAMRAAGLDAPMVLIRSPMIGQARRVVSQADRSFNTELDVIDALSTAAHDAGVTHEIVLMVELGDLREGIMPAELQSVVRQVLRFPNIRVVGIGSNLACCNGVAPDVRNMSELSALAQLLEVETGYALCTVTGGNSSALGWALQSADVGRINNLRLGESILLGRNPLNRHAIDGLFTDAFTLVAEVIEAKCKPSKPWGRVEQTAFGAKASTLDRGFETRCLLALGEQDTDPSGLDPPSGVTVVGSSSDHLIATVPADSVYVGGEMSFQLNYSALVRAMTSPFVAKRILSRGAMSRPCD